MNVMHIFVIGERLRGYPRNDVLLSALSDVHKTTECDMAKYSTWSRIKSLWSARNSYDALLAVQPTKKFVFPLLIIRPFWRGKYIGDAFTSLYDSFVFDRKLAGRWSVKAAYYFLLDWVFTHLCDVLFFDTMEHKEYFDRTFSLRTRPALIVPVAVDLNVMRSVTKKKLPHAEDGKFQVLFCGYFIPLQGVEHIIRAAHILRDHKDIRFTLLGSGQTKQKMEELVDSLSLPSLIFMGRVPYVDLLAYTKGVDLSLGIFGKSDKAKRVVANKVIESAALGVPIVTGRSAPVERFFEEGKNIFFSNMGDPVDLANAILRAYNTAELPRVGSAGQDVVARNFSVEHLRQIFKTL